MQPVLVVDDQPDIIKLIKKILERAGFGDVAGARSKEEALKKLEEQRFPLVILDHQLSGTKGSQLITEVRDINPYANVVMLSGHLGPEILQECLDRGAVDFFEKPPDNSRLVEVMKNLNKKVERWQIFL